MKDCLHTQLKGEVSNDNLPILGELVMHIVNNDSAKEMPFTTENSVEYNAYIVGDGYFYKGTLSNPTDQTKNIENVLTTSGWNLSEGEYDVHITQKYTLTKINFGYENLNTCDYTVNFDINALRFSPLSLVMAEIFVGSGDFDLFSNITSITIRANEYIAASFSEIAKVINIANNQRYPALGWKELSFEPFVENANATLYGKTIKAASNVTPGFFPTMNGEQTGGVETVFAANGDATCTYSVGGVAKTATYVKSTDTWSYS